MSTYKICFAIVEISLILKLYLGCFGVNKVIFISSASNLFRILKKFIFCTNSFATHKTVIIVLSLFIFVYLLLVELYTYLNCATKLFFFCCVEFQSEKPN